MNKGTMDSEKRPLLPQPRKRDVQLGRGAEYSFFWYCILMTIFAITFFSRGHLEFRKDCIDDELGYICRPEISRLWGQYSPFWKLESKIPDEVPEGCEITFAQLLSRHGAREPNLKYTVRYITTITKIQALGTFEGKYKFLKDFRFNLGVDDLNAFGRRELRSTGRNFRSRYHHLGEPFVRTAAQQRVVDSTKAFLEGYGRKLPMTVINEGPHCNNTLAHSICVNLESGPLSQIRLAARTAFASVFLPPIALRLSKDLKMSVDVEEAHDLMSMCPMETVSTPRGHLSPFCDLFTTQEFHQYNHFESLEKFYGPGKGNPLGPTQGIGFANELIARMLSRPVEDHTSTNHTLDDNPKTFPLDRKIFADFSHDNDLTSAFFALGLFKSVPMLSISQVDSPEFTKGWSSALTVPFAARAYFEKMKCKGHDEEMVRAVVNHRVIPLEGCSPDELGRCTLSKYIDSLSFARSGGNWDLCFLGASALNSTTETTLEAILQTHPPGQNSYLV